MPVPVPPPPEAPPDLAGFPAPPVFDTLTPLPPPPAIEEEAAETAPEELEVASGRPRPAIGQLETGLGIELPGSLLQQAMRGNSSGNLSPRIVVGGLGSAGSPGSVTEARSLPRSPTNTGSQIEMLSDPGGVDFQPYLIQVLASVRRNWAVLIPESVRLGQRGRVAIQVAIETSGSIPKLVIASSSGFAPLDRAAVGAITASEPFPALPREFTGSEIRLQFNFLYNRER